MSGRLVGEVAEWLCSPAAAGVTPAERTVLLLIAERVNEKDPERKMLRHRSDDVTLFERLCRGLGMDRSGLTEVLKRLAARKLEVRIKIGETRAGKPVFAHRGRAMGFRLPMLPASVALAESIGPDRPIEADGAVDNPGDDAPDGPPAAMERVGPDRPNEPKGSVGADANAGKGRSGPIPNPSKDSPSKDSPSTPVDLSSHLNLEDARPAAEPQRQTSDHLGWEPTYRDASAFLQTLPDFGDEYMTAAAEKLGPAAPVADRVIYAAQIAHQGVLT